MRDAQPATMPPVTTNKAGIETQRKILLALLERQPRTVHGLARAVGRDVSTVSAHLENLSLSNVVAISRRRGRGGSVVRLTDTGTMVARMMAT